MSNSTSAEALLALLDLERIDTHVWRGQNEERAGLRLFGGQVLAQALAAASATVDAARPCHSLHGYFLRPGRAELPVIYRVEPIRDGRSFTTRRILAIQEGEAIFSMDASFQVQEPGLTHQIDMQAVIPPEALQDDRELGSADDDPQTQWSLRERPFEIRSVYQTQTAADDETCYPIWIRFRQTVDVDQHRQRCLLAYASDMSLVSTAMLPHRSQVSRREIQMASLDHALWFHRDLDINDWLVYIKETTQGGAGRGFNRGGFYTRDGQLVASAMQEGLMRVVSRADR